jgi:hypothetical protein
MNWTEGHKACKNMVGNWRLPTIDELNKIWVNKDKIGGFNDGSYWSSSSEMSDGFLMYLVKNFETGRIEKVPALIASDYKFNVRAVQTIEYFDNTGFNNFIAPYIKINS